MDLTLLTMGFESFGDFILMTINVNKFTALLTFNWEICVTFQYFTKFSVSETVSLFRLVNIQYISCLTVHIPAFLDLGRNFYSLKKIRQITINTGQKLEFTSTTFNFLLA